MESQQSIGGEDPKLLGASGTTVELVHLFDKFKAVRSFIFDVDGVLTDNSLLVTEEGELLRTMNIRDGYAIKTAIQAGYPVAIITGGRSTGVRKRLQNLGIVEYHDGIADKGAVLNQILQKPGFALSEMCYMGDDILDLPVLRRVMCSACPTDSVSEVLHVVDYISPVPGGRGCVRDVIEKVLKLQGNWPKL